MGYFQTFLQNVLVNRGADYFLPLFLCGLLLFVLTYLPWKSSHRIWTAVMGLSIFACCIAFRNLGADSVFYAKFFEVSPSSFYIQMDGGFWARYFGISSPIFSDPLFFLLVSAIKKTTIHLPFFFLILYLLIMMFFMVFAKNQLKTRAFLFSLLLFLISIGSFSLGANVLRQGLSIVIGLLGLEWIRRDRTAPDGPIFLMTAVLFHWSFLFVLAFIMMLDYWSKKWSEKRIFLIALGIGLFFMVIPITAITSISPSAYFSGVFESGARGSVKVRWLVNIAVCIFLVYGFRRRQTALEPLRWLLHLRLCLLLLQSLTLQFPEMFVRITLISVCLDPILAGAVIDQLLPRERKIKFVAAGILLIAIVSYLTVNSPTVVDILGL